MHVIKLFIYKTDENKHVWRKNGFEFQKNWNIYTTNSE